MGCVGSQSAQGAQDATQRELFELRAQNKRLQGEVATLRAQLAEAERAASRASPDQGPSAVCQESLERKPEDAPPPDKAEQSVGEFGNENAAARCSKSPRPCAPPAGEPVAEPQPTEVPHGELVLEATTSYSYVMVGGQNAKEDNGACMLCLEALPNDPREVVNLCSASPRCLCLLHKRCFLNPKHEMNDQFRRCMICKKPADPALVRQAVAARQKR